MNNFNKNILDLDSVTDDIFLKYIFVLEYNGIIEFDHKFVIDKYIRCDLSVNGLRKYYFDLINQNLCAKNNIIEFIRDIFQEGIEERFNAIKSEIYND
jgi:hypothetical protein